MSEEGRETHYPLFSIADSFPTSGPEFESMAKHFEEIGITRSKPQKDLSDPDQIDWGATNTKKMTEKEKQEIRERGLVGEAYRLS